MAAEVTQFVDISGTSLNTGDMVAVHYEQAFRIGRIDGFTKKQVIVTFDFGATMLGYAPSYQQARLYPYKLAKVVNQNIGLQDYYQYLPS